MSGEQTDIQLLISAKDQASQALKKISAEATRVGRELDKAKQKLDKTGEGAADVARLEREFKQLNGQVKRYNTALGQTARAQKQVQQTGSSLAGTLATIGFAELARQAVLAASALQDATSASAAVLGDQAAAVQRFADDASKSFGLSERAALEAVTNFSSMGKAAGLTGEELSEFGIQLTERAADLASFWGAPQQEAIDALRSGLNGETEPLRRFGIFLDDATLKAEAMSQGLIETTKNALTPQQKVLAASAVIFQQNTDSIGDYARTQESAANVIKTAQAEYENLSSTIGSELLPVVVEVLRPVGDLASALEALPDGAITTALAMGGIGFAARKAAPEIDKMRTSMSSARAETGLLRSAASGAVGMLGGPWGAALTVGAGLLTLFASRSDEATRSQSDYGAQLGETAEALRLRNAQTAAQTLADAGALDQAEQLGIASEDVIRAVLSEGDARQQLIPRIESAAEAYDFLVRSQQLGLPVAEGQIDAAREQSVAARALLDTLDGEAEAFDRTTAASNAASRALDGVGAGAADTRSEVERLTEALNPLIGTLDRLSGRADLAASFRGARSALGDFIDEVDGAPRRIRLSTEAGQNAFEGLIGPIRTAEAEAKRLLEAGEINEEQATAKVARVTERVLALARQAQVGGAAIRAIRDGLNSLTDKTVTVTVRQVGGGFGPQAEGDTSTPHGVAMPGGAVGAFHASLAGSLPGSQMVSSGIRDWALGSPDSDHRHGRAYDLVGSNLDAYRARVQAMGGLAEFHGTGKARHLHVVPFTAKNAGGGITMTNNIHQVASGVDLQAELHRFARTQARMSERQPRRRG